MLDFIFGHDCQICHTKTREYLISNEKGGRDIKTWLCRNHLISEFRRFFIVYPHKLLVCKPDEGWISYCYYDCQNFLMYGSAGIEHSDIDCRFSKSDQDAFIKIVGELSGKKCQSCDLEASVVYTTNKHWQGEFDIEKKYLCKNHAFDEIESLLISNSKFFRSGVYLPNNGDGVYVSEWL